MKVDIRIPLGLLFVAIGMLLAAFGMVSDSRLYERSLHININLWWGAVLFLFGLVMFLLGWRRGKEKIGSSGDRLIGSSE